MANDSYVRFLIYDSPPGGIELDTKPNQFTKAIPTYIRRETI